MDIFKKTIKYSKPSIEIDNKIKDLNEGLNKTKSTLSEQKLSEEEVDRLLNEHIVDVENWKEIFDENTVSEYEQQINEVRGRHNDLIKVQGSLEYVKNKEVKEIFTELYQGEVERVVDAYVSKYSNDIIDLREDLFHEIKKKPVVDLGVLEEKINLLTLKYNQLSEGLLNEPSTGLKDPVTFEQLKNHYQLLVGRLQEQLSTLGGGGEVRLQYLDDIVGIATNASAYDGKFLKYNHSLKKFEFVTVTGGSGIGLTDLSVTTNSAGAAALSYNNNGVFTYTPPSFVGYATEGYVDNAVVGFITTGASGAGLKSLTGASAGTYGNATNSAQITVDSNGRITGIAQTGISGLSSRGSLSQSTGSIGAGTTTNITITGYKSYMLQKISTSHAAWIRLYTDTTSRTADESREHTTDPLPGSGVIAEVRTTTSGISTFIMSPGVMGWNNDSTPGNNIYARVTNNESGSSDITVTLTALQLES